MAEALLFRSGCAAYFDTDGRQLPSLQWAGWSGLHQFLQLYPAATVRLQGSDAMTAPEVARLLTQIRLPGGYP